MSNGIPAVARSPTEVHVEPSLVTGSSLYTVVSSELSPGVPISLVSLKTP